MKLLTVNLIIDLQSLTFMYVAFKGLLPVNLQTRFNLNTGNKRCQNNFKCQYSWTTRKQHCLSFIGVKLCNKTDKWILNSNNIHMFKKKYKNYLVQMYMRNNTYNQNLEC